MTPYYWTRPIFWLLFIGLISFWYFSYLPIWVAIFFGLSYATFLAWAAFHMNANFFTTSIIQGKPHKKGIALTFDDGPHSEHTKEVLAVLEKHNAKATFFLIGENVKSNNDLVLLIAKQGHLIANHSTTHAKWIDFNNTSQWKTEIEETRSIIKSSIGKSPNWFRPPYGVTTPNIDKAIKNTGVKSIGWSVRSLDTLNNNVSEIVQRATTNLKDGSIVLFHDNLPWSAQVLDEFLIKANSMNLNIVPLNELIDEKAYD